MLRKTCSLLLIALLLAALAPVPSAEAYYESAWLYGNAYDCIRLLEGEANWSSGSTAYYYYQTRDYVLQPAAHIDDDVYHDRVVNLVHMIFTGSPAFFIADYYGEYEDGYRNSIFNLEMRVDAAPARTWEARNMAWRVVNEVITDGMSPRDKYFALYEWVATHITYDSRASRASAHDGNDAFLAGQSFENALLNRTAVCGGIGRAYMLLCQYAGLPVLFITGNASTDHAWNKIYLYGEWLNVDVTDACTRQNADAGYFAARDEDMAGSRYYPQLSDYLYIVPYLYPNIEWNYPAHTMPPVPTYALAPEPPPPPEPEPAPVPPYGPGGVNVTVDGEYITFDVPPQIVNGRTLVPLRAIFETMGADVRWDGATRTVNAVKDGITLILVINDPAPTINGRVTPIDQPGVIIGGRTLAPLRFVAEAFGGTVYWDEAAKTAHVTK